MEPFRALKDSGESCSHTKCATLAPLPHLQHLPPLPYLLHFLYFEHLLVASCYSSHSIKCATLATVKPQLPHLTMRLKLLLTVGTKKPPLFSKKKNYVHCVFEHIPFGCFQCKIIVGIFCKSFGWRLLDWTKICRVCEWLLMRLVDGSSYYESMRCL